MMTLQKLITLAPFSTEMRKELLEKSEQFSDDKKFELEELCWGLISQWYHNEVASRSERAILEAATSELEDTQQGSSKDISKIPDEVFAELIAKFDAASSEEEIEELREKLATINPAQQN